MITLNRLILKKENKMKKLFTIMFTLALVFAFTAAYAADQSGTMSGSGAAGTIDRSTTGTTDSTVSDMSAISSSAALKASDVIGFNVENRQGENLGEISDLAIDPQSGRVAFALLSQGGVLGVGAKYTPVPISALTFSDNKAILDVSKDRLASAPSFDSDQWPSISDRTQIGETYRYFGVTPYWEESGIQMQPGVQPDIHRDMQPDIRQSPDMNAPTDMKAPGRTGF
jgi:sporulation protein YlmC with PRC-barrel domain